jgi:hypothetical protein
MANHRKNHLEFKVDCTGDAVCGDYVFFQRAVFNGSWRKPTFSHYEDVEGEIIRDSYGEAKQQHTFTILLPDGSTTRIKGRNLYRNGTERLLWIDEEERKAVAEEKHYRGSAARRMAAERRGY